MEREEYNAPLETTVNVEIPTAEVHLVRAATLRGVIVKALYSTNK